MPVTRGDRQFRSFVFTMASSTLKNEVKEQEESLPSSPRSVILMSIVKSKDFISSIANLMKGVWVVVFLLAHF